MKRKREEERAIKNAYAHGMYVLWAAVMLRCLAFMSIVVMICARTVTLQCVSAAVSCQSISVSLFSVAVSRFSMPTRQVARTFAYANIHTQVFYSLVHVTWCMCPQGIPRGKGIKWVQWDKQTFTKKEKKKRKKRNSRNKRTRQVYFCLYTQLLLLKWIWATSSKVQR